MEYPCTSISFSTNQPYWEHFKSSPVKDLYSIQDYWYDTKTNVKYQILGRSPSGFFILCQQSDTKVLSVWGLKILSTHIDFLQTEYSWDLLIENIEGIDVHTYSYYGSVFDEYKVTDKSDPQITLCILFFKDSQQDVFEMFFTQETDDYEIAGKNMFYAHLMCNIGWRQVDFQLQIQQSYQYLKDINMGSDEYPWVLRLQNMILEQKNKIKTYCDINYDFVWEKNKQTADCPDHQQLTIVGDYSTTISIENKTRKRGRPKGRRDCIKRNRANNLSSDMHFRGKFTLLKLLLLSRDFQSWSIDTDLCSLFVLTETYNEWFSERGIDPLYKQLYDWLAITKDAVMNSHFFTQSFTWEYLKSLSNERRKQNLQLLDSFQHWYQDGAPQEELFSKNMDIKQMPSKPFALSGCCWFEQNHKQLLKIGRLKLKQIKDVYTRLRNNPTHLTFFHQKEILEKLKKDCLKHLHSQSYSEDDISGANIDAMFSKVEGILQKGVQYGEYVEQLIMNLQNIKKKNMELLTSMSCFESENHTTNKVESEVYNQFLKVAISNAVEHLKSTTEQRFVSMVPSQVSHPLLDFFSIYSTYPSITTVHSSVVPLVQFHKTPNHSTLPLERV